MNVCFGDEGSKTKQKSDDAVKSAKMSAARASISVLLSRISIASECPKRTWGTAVHSVISLSPDEIDHKVSSRSSTFIHAS